MMQLNRVHTVHTQISSQLEAPTFHSPYNSHILLGRIPGTPIVMLHSPYLTILDGYILFQRPAYRPFWGLNGMEDNL